MYNHTPRRSNKYSLIEIFTHSISIHSQLQYVHPWGYSVYILDSQLLNRFKIPRFNTQSRQNIYMDISPLHASSVKIILNPNINQLSPQYHCVYNNYFETIIFSKISLHKLGQDCY